MMPAFYKTNSGNKVIILVVAKNPRRRKEPPVVVKNPRCRKEPPVVVKNPRRRKEPSHTDERAIEQKEQDSIKEERREGLQIMETRASVAYKFYMEWLHYSEVECYSYYSERVLCSRGILCYLRKGCYVKKTCYLEGMSNVISERRITPGWCVLQLEWPIVTAEITYCCYGWNGLWLQLERPLIERLEWPLIERLEWPLIERLEWPVVKRLKWPVVERLEWPIVKRLEWPVIERLEWPVIIVVESWNGLYR